MHATAETPGTSAYALYILDVGHRGSLLDLMLAVASCCLGYGEVGLLLKERVDRGEDGYHSEGNPYKQCVALVCQPLTPFLTEARACPLPQVDERLCRR